MKLQTRFVEGDFVYIVYQPANKPHLLFHGPCKITKIALESQRVAAGGVDWNILTWYYVEHFDLKYGSEIVFGTLDEAMQKIQEWIPPTNPPQEQPKG